MRLLLATVLLALSSPACAASPVTTGERVRVTLIAREPAPVVGRVLELPSDAILLSAEPDSAPRAIPRAAIARLEVHRGTGTNAGRGAVIGALIVGIPASLLGIFGAGVTEEPGGLSTTEAALVAGGAGAVLGAGIGALIGKSEKHERWEEVAP